MTNPQQPERIGKYDILDVLGRGGMGVVYRAQDKRMGRMVAIKTVLQDFSTDSSMLERFYHEAEKTGRLKHPNIVTVYDLGEQDGCPYIVMEYVDGLPLDSILRDGRSMPMLDKLRILEQVCSALGYAHQHDVIHRDVKPANVIVQNDGCAKLLDFGIAREERRTNQGLTRVGAVIGTVPYMAPERLKGQEIDGRSDIFAAGVMLFQVLTGQLPFQGEDALLVSKLLTERHPPLGMYLREYPAALDRILDHALAKLPDERYSSADEMAAELCSVIDELKREHIDDRLVQVRRLITDQQHVQARETLTQVLKLDNQHAEARRLLAEVQQHLFRRQREEQAQQLAQRAEDHLRERNYEQATEMLQQAAELAPESVAYLEPLTRDLDRPAIRTVLAQARIQQEEIREKADAASANLEPLLEAEGYEQVLAYLETLPPQVHAQPALQAALRKAQEGLELERAHVEFLGKSYAVLGAPDQAGHWNGMQATPSGGVLGEMARAFERRRLGLATRTITAEIEIVRAKLMTGEAPSAEELLQGKAQLVPFCTPEAQTEWNSLIEQLRARNKTRIAGKAQRED